MALIQEYDKLYEQNSNIKKIYVNGNRVWPIKFIDYSEPFYVENITNNTETLSIVKSSTGAPTVTVYYSRDRVNWTSLGSTSTIALTLTLNPGDRYYLRASAIRWGSSGSGRNAILGCSKVGGNIMSLLYGSNFTGAETTFPSNTSYAFRYLFRENDVLQDASDLILPALTLTNKCYAGMFLKCYALINGPKKLPHPTTVAPYCYAEMFHICTSVVNTPELTWDVLPEGCYDRMFRGCEALTKVVCLATDVSAYQCTYLWFEDASTTGTFYCKDASIWSRDDSGVPTGWTIVEV